METASFSAKENIKNNARTPIESTNDDQFKSRKRITKEFLKSLLRSDIKLYYCTPTLNDILYLHYKGFDCIENLEEFDQLKVLYLEGNCISRIENLSNKSQLRALYLQENLISRIENLEFLESLTTLNLSDNFVATIEGLDKNTELESLQLKRNKIGVNGLSDLTHLSRLGKLASLDVSNNFIDCDPEAYLQVLEGCPKLAVLYMMNNPICNKIANYRKTLVARLKGLKYLDDRPVFPEERVFAEAFYFHGIEAERRAREEWKRQEEERHWRNHEAFKAMLNSARQNREASESNAPNEQSGPVESVQSTQAVHTESLHTSHLETYYSKTEGDSERLADSMEQVDDGSVEKERKSEGNMNDSMSVSEEAKETKSVNTDFEALD